MTPDYTNLQSSLIFSGNNSQIFGVVNMVVASLQIAGDPAKSFGLEGSLDGMNFEAISDTDGNATNSVGSPPVLFSISKYKLIRVVIASPSTHSITMKALSI